MCLSSPVPDAPSAAPVPAVSRPSFPTLGVISERSGGAHARAAGGGPLVPTRQMWQPFSASSATFFIHLAWILSNDDLREHSAPRRGRPRSARARPRENAATACLGIRPSRLLCRLSDSNDRRPATSARAARLRPVVGAGLPDRPLPLPAAVGGRCPVPVGRGRARGGARARRRDGGVHA